MKYLILLVALISSPAFAGEHKLIITSTTTYKTMDELLTVIEVKEHMVTRPASALVRAVDGVEPCIEVADGYITLPKKEIYVGY